MNAPTLVIMAAGMGSRFGGLKQMTPVDDRGHFIMDYSIFDAVRAGFGKVVCVIKEEMRQDFEEKIGSRVRSRVELAYAYQSLDRIPEGFSIPAGRVKPWGTGHAVLCAAPEVSGPFAVINADDFYGSEAFRAMADFLSRERPASQQAMVGYALKNTLTENGSVSRGVCDTDAQDYLTGITERTRIESLSGGPAFTEDGENWQTLSPDTVVSMNMWGFQQPVLEVMEDLFREFLVKSVPRNPMKAEFYLPSVPSRMIEAGTGSVRVLRAGAKWYGVTYKEDLPGVVTALAAMRRDGKYPEDLWG